jgi:hypothetical protein
LTIQKLGILACAGALLLAGAACQKKADDASVTVTPGATAEVAPTAAPAEPVQAEERVTADPIAANQKNAARRRKAQESRPSSPAPAEPAAPATRSLEVPSGTILRAAFDTPITSETAKVGDRVDGSLLDSLLADDGTAVADSGARVRAEVENAKSAGALGGRSELRFRIKEIQIGGDWHPVSTSAYDAIGETHTKKNIGYIAGGAAVGAILGQVLGKDTESTLKGAAAGAAAGTGAAAIKGGSEITIEKGRTVAFTLESPLVIRG